MRRPRLGALLRFCQAAWGGLTGPKPWPGALQRSAMSEGDSWAAAGRRKRGWGEVDGAAPRAVARVGSPVRRPCAFPASNSPLLDLMSLTCKQDGSWLCIRGSGLGKQCVGGGAAVDAGVWWQPRKRGRSGLYAGRSTVGVWESVWGRGGRGGSMGERGWCCQGCMRVQDSRAGVVMHRWRVAGKWAGGQARRCRVHTPAGCMTWA